MHYCTTLYHNIFKCMITTNSLLNLRACFLKFLVSISMQGSHLGLQLFRAVHHERGTNHHRIKENGISSYYMLKQRCCDLWLLILKWWSQSLIYFFGHLFSAGVWNGTPETIYNGDHYVYFIKQENVVPCTQSLINSWNIFSYFFLILFKWVNMWG